MDLSVVYKFKLLLWQGFLITVELSVLAIIFGTLVGCIICMARTSHFKILSAPAAGFIEIFRGSPLLMQLFMFYFGLPYLGQMLVNTSPQLAVALQNLSQLAITILVFALYGGAYIAEIFRSGFQSIPSGQFEAASSIGLTYMQSFTKVILPQMLRVVYPALVGFYIGMVKDTSLASIIGYQELIKQAQGIINITSKPLEVYLVVAAIYFIICFPLSQIVGQAERRLVA